MIASRIVLGAGEGPAAPVATHAIYKWFPDSLRGLPTAILAQGSAIGVIVAVPIAVCDHQALLLALGVRRARHRGLLWTLLWLIFGREGTLVDPPVEPRRGRRRPRALPLPADLPQHRRGVLRGLRSYWGLALGLTWFPSYMMSGLGLHAEGRPQSQHPALAVRRRGRAGRRLPLAAPEVEGRVEPRSAAACSPAPPWCWAAAPCPSSR